LVQIAHAGGGAPRRDGNNLAVLRNFADHIVRDDPVTRHVLFAICPTCLLRTKRLKQLLVL
jgi:hypothetical protein